jgi:hypothetical protein
MATNIQIHAANILLKFQSTRRKTEKSPPARQGGSFDQTRERFCDPESSSERALLKSMTDDSQAAID